MPSMSFFFLCVLSYFIGAIPFGLIFGRVFAGVDVRSQGSRNIGATNVNRVLGKKLGAATLLTDFSKALIPILFANLILGSAFLSAIVGLCAVVGHCFPIYLKFSGGKGVASAFGMTVGIAPFSALVALVIWIIVFRISRTSALGALSASASIPFLVFFERQMSWSLALVFFVLVSLIVYRHKENIERLKKGKELKFTAEN